VCERRLHIRRAGDEYARVRTAANTLLVTRVNNYALPTDNPVGRGERTVSIGRFKSLRVYE